MSYPKGLPILYTCAYPGYIYKAGDIVKTPLYSSKLRGRAKLEYYNLAKRLFTKKTAVIKGIRTCWEDESDSPIYLVTLSNGQEYPFAKHDIEEPLTSAEIESRIDEIKREIKNTTCPKCGRKLAETGAGRYCYPCQYYRRK